MTTDSAWFVGLLCDVSLKAIVLAAIAAVGLWLFRVRSTSVQHRVWLAVMVAMLMLPLLVAATPAVPLPGWAYPNFRTADASLPEQTAGNSAYGQVEPGDGRAVATDAAAIESAYNAAPEMLPLESSNSEQSTGSPAIESTPIARNWSDRVFLLAAIVYVLGLWLFASRLAYGVLVARRLVRTATRIDPGDEQAQMLDGTPVLESSGVRRAADRWLVATGDTAAHRLA